MSSLLILYQSYLKFNLKHHIPLILNMKKMCLRFSHEFNLGHNTSQTAVNINTSYDEVSTCYYTVRCYFLKLHCGRSISENSNRTKPDNNWITNRIKLTLKYQGNVWDNKYQYFNNIGPPEKNWHGEKHDK